jgi:GNAT superfamily N-acetyltransferase
VVKPVLYDLRKKLDTPRVHYLFQKEMELIEERQERLHENYTWRRMNWKEYLSFTVLYDEEADRIIGFSGLQYGRWGEKLARCASRLWVNPDYRGRSTPSNWNSRWMMPFQIKNAPDYLDGVFWSREYPNHHNFPLMVQRANENCSHGYQHTEQPGVWNVCRPVPNENAINMDKTCWQKVALIKFNPDFELNLPDMTMDEYNARFS